MHDMRRYEDLRSGLHVSKREDWDETVKVKRSMHRVEIAKDDTHVYECIANPHRLTCGCKAFRQEVMCKHVLAVNHIIEAKKAEGERNAAVNLELLNTAVRRDKVRGELTAYGRGWKNGYKMSTNRHLTGGAQDRGQAKAVTAQYKKKRAEECKREKGAVELLLPPSCRRV